MNSGLISIRGNGDVANLFPHRVRDPQPEVVDRLLQAELNDAFDRRILADEVLVSPELVVAIVLRLPLERRPDVNSFASPAAVCAAEYS